MIVFPTLNLLLTSVRKANSLGSLFWQWNILFVYTVGIQFTDSYGIQMVRNILIIKWSVIQTTIPKDGIKCLLLEW